MIDAPDEEARARACALAKVAALLPDRFRLFPLAQARAERQTDRENEIVPEESAQPTPEARRGIQVAVEFHPLGRGRAARRQSP